MPATRENRKFSSASQFAKPPYVERSSFRSCSTQHSPLPSTPQNGTTSTSRVRRNSRPRARPRRQWRLRSGLYCSAVRTKVQSEKCKVKSEKCNARDRYRSHQPSSQQAFTIVHCPGSHGIRSRTRQVKGRDRFLPCRRVIDGQRLNKHEHSKSASRTFEKKRAHRARTVPTDTLITSGSPVAERSSDRVHI